MDHRRRWLVRAVAVLCAVVVLPPPALAAGSLAVTGYAEDGIAPSRVAAAAPALTTLGADGVNIDPAGATVSWPGAGLRTLLAQAHGLGLRGELLVGNYSSRLGDFDPVAVHRLLTSPANRAAVVGRLARAVQLQGWDGVQIDLELIPAADADEMVAFARELSRALPDRVGVSMAVTACATRQQYLDHGYDLPALGRVLDRVVLMAYDQHGPGWGHPGPVGGLPWQERTLRSMLRAVPAAKVDLGVAGYGYTWPVEGRGRLVGDAQARDLVARDGAAATFDPVQGEWTATLSTGTVLWWSDARSWTLRRALATRYALHGMALWSLGHADPPT